MHLMKKHGKPAWHKVNARYRHRDTKGRITFIHHLEDGSPLWLYRMADRPIRRYWVPWQRPTYGDGGIRTKLADDPSAFVEPMAYPARDKDQVRLIVLRRDRHTCQRCQAQKSDLHVHHIIPKHDGGTDTPENLITLCSACHREIHRTKAVEGGS